MRARFLKPAGAEVDEAIAYFDEQRESLGARFEEDLLNTVRLVTDHPFAGKLLTDSVRKFRFRRFRYNLIYVVDGDEILIVAVAHHSRRPGYWRGRLSGFN